MRFSYHLKTHNFYCLLSCFLILLLAIVTDASASPIYVYKKGKAITFSSRPPQPGVETKVYTGKSASFSIIKSERFSSLGKGSFGRYRSFNGTGGYRHAVRPSSNRQYDQYIREASSEFGVDNSLIRAVIHAESGFNPRAVSPKGALGLMQLMPGTARMHGVRKVFEPRDNIRGGTRHLAKLLRRYRGNLVYSIAAYNAGEGAVDQHRGVPPYSETRQYVNKVLALQSQYKNFSQS